MTGAPEKPAETPAQPDTQITWIAAEKETRDAAKWFAVALGGVGTVVFGAVPVVAASTFRWDLDRPQLAMVAVSAAVALGSILVLVYRITQFLVPKKINLFTVDADTAAATAEQIRVYLPSGVDDLDQFKKRITERAALHKELVTGILAQTDKIRLLEEAITTASDAVVVAAHAADRTGPNSPESADLARSRQDLQRLQDELAQRTSDLERQQSYESSTRAAIRGDQIRTDKIQAEIGLATLQTSFAQSGRRLRAPAFLMVGGVVAFMVTLLIEPTQAPTPASAQIGVLTRVSSAPDPAWAASGLQACEASDGTVPVLVLEQAGNAMTVRTIPSTAGCAVRTLTLDTSYAIVAIPEASTVTLTVVTNPR